MLRKLLFPCALLVAGAADGAAAPVGALEVREGHAGVPCFTISEAQERRSGAPDFQSIAVREAGSHHKGALAWSMTLAGARTFAVTFRMCIPYAGRLPVLPQTPAAELRPGQVYEVGMEVRMPAPATSKLAAPRIYRGWFCIARQGQRRVQALDAAQASAAGARGCPP